MSRWQGFDTEDYHVCEECGAAWDTERQAEECGSEDRLAERFERTCAYCDVIYPSADLAEKCEAGHAAEQASDRT